MLTSVQQLILSQNLRDFPILAAASAAIKKCPTCKHTNASPNTILRAAIVRLRNNPKFHDFLKKFVKLPVVLGGILIEDK